MKATGLKFRGKSMKDVHNTEFIVNCVNYLCADDDLLQLRSKNFRIGSLNKEKIRGHKTFLATLNIVIPLAVIAIMGIILILLRKSKFSRKNSK